MYTPYPLPCLPPGLLDQRALSRSAADRFAQTEHLRTSPSRHLHTVRLRLARWIAPAGLQPVTR